MIFFLCIFNKNAHVKKLQLLSHNNIGIKFEDVSYIMSILVSLFTARQHNIEVFPCEHQSETNVMVYQGCSQQLHLSQGVLWTSNCCAFTTA